MQTRKRERKVFIYASALAGAYLFLYGVSPCIFSVSSESHPREKLSSYTTYFNENDGGRCENIRLSARRLNGIALQPYGEFSFNGAVGPRTKESGYKEAKVISGGEFVVGVGGGVCQVSTTLYNAAILSGLTVLEYHPHSLRVGYVPPSRDAMVSSYSDLRLYNPHPETVYISAEVGKDWLRFTLYGKPDGRTYSIESRTLQEIPPQQPIVEEGAEGILRYGVNGLRSESYLYTYEKGVLIAARRLRADEYAPQRGVIGKKSEKAG